MNFKKIITNLVLITCLSFGATLLLPTNKAEASTGSAIWFGCKASIGGADVNSNGRAWAIMNTSNKACKIKITMTYYNAKKQKVTNSTGWYQQQTIGLTASQQTIKNSKVVYYFHVDAGAFGSTYQIYTVWT